MKKTINKLRKLSKLKKIIIIGSPLHRNLGDHAIAIAQLKFIKDNINRTVIEIPGCQFAQHKREILLNITNEDIILISGGGFLGDLWINEEQMVRSVIKTFKNNKIIIMPQTIFFEKEEELQISKTIYEGHKNLHICLRERNSFKFIKREFSEMKHVYYVPDIVFYLNELYVGKRKHTVALCFRSDKEKVLEDDLINKITNQILDLGYKVNIISTLTKSPIPIYFRKIYLKKSFKQFNQNELVVTDRLHGMIFCAITGTPCIAFDNLSGKVKGVYKWIESLNYIRVLDENSDLESIMKYLVSQHSLIYDFNFDLYDKIKMIMIS